MYQNGIYIWIDRTFVIPRDRCIQYLTISSSEHVRSRHKDRVSLTPKMAISLSHGGFCMPCMRSATIFVSEPTNYDGSEKYYCLPVDAQGTATLQHQMRVLGFMATPLHMSWF